MSYTPRNVFVYAAAQAGAMAGMQQPGSPVLTNPESIDYAILAASAGAFAQEFDTQWGSSDVPNIYDAQSIADACAQLWSTRTVLPQVDIFGRVLVNFASPAIYASEVAALIAMIQAGDAFNALQGTTLPAAGSSGTSTLTTFATDLSTTIPTAAQEAIFVSGYTSAYDGGQGYFVWAPLSTATPDGGTVFQVTGIAVGRWMRVYDANMWVTWFGAKGDGATDDSAAIQNTIQAAGPCGTVFFPFLGGTSATKYVIKNPLTIDMLAGNNGITLLGQGVNVNTSTGLQCTIVADLPILSGTAASLVSQVGNIVTITGLTGLTNEFGIGDCITISGATSTDGGGNLVNDGSFTLTSVNPGAGSATYFGYNPQVGFADTSPSPVTPDANNGHISWTIRKNMIVGTAEFIHIENLTLDGGSNAGNLIYTTNKTGAASTQWTHVGVNFFGGVYGLSGGDIPLDYPTTSYPVGNNEFFVFSQCAWSGQFAGVKVGLGGQAKDWIFDTNCSFQEQTYVGFWGWTGSVSFYNTVFESCPTNFQFVDPDDTIYLCEVESESSARLFVTGFGTATSAAATSFSLLAENCRFDTTPELMDPNGAFIQWIYNGGLQLKNCEFSVGESGFGGTATPLTVCLSGFGNPAVANNAKILATIEACGFPNSLPSVIVTRPSGEGAFFGQWSSKGNYCDDGQGIDYPIPDGINTVNAPPVAAVSASLAGTFTPTIGSNLVVTSVSQVGTVAPGSVLSFLTSGAGQFEVIAVTAGHLEISVNYPAGYPGSGAAGTVGLITGQLPVPNQQLQYVTPVMNFAPTVVATNVIDLPNNGFTNVELNSGSGTGFNLCGMMFLGVVDQVRVITNLTGGSFTIKNESATEPALWNRFHNPAGTDAVVTMSATVRYSGGLNRWVIQSFQ
jgi:hypothetical protein